MSPVRSVCALAFLSCALTCSDFYMEPNGTEFRISVRTMDLGFEGNWELVVIPRAQRSSQEVCLDQSFKKTDCLVPGALSWTSQYGYVGFSASSGGFPSNDTIGEGMNEKGLSCGVLALVGTHMPPASKSGRNLHVNYLCQYILENFDDVEQVKAGVGGLTVWGPNYAHWVVRDANGNSLVIEFPNEKMVVYDDKNDDGETGYGIMTNEPMFDWHLKNIEHLNWKRGLARQAVAIPGEWYPEARFMRIYMVKKEMPALRTYQQAVSQAVHVLNTVTVPMGTPPGTDSGAHSGEGDGDHTLWGVVRDHAQKIIYYRGDANPSLQRLRLEDMNLEAGASKIRMDVKAGDWFIDAAHRLQRPNVEV